MDAAILRTSMRLERYIMDTTKLNSYTVGDIMRILNISRTHAYAFVNDDAPFRILRIGNAIRIPKDSFDNWFNGTQDDTSAIKSVKGGR